MASRNDSDPSGPSHDDGSEQDAIQKRQQQQQQQQKALASPISPSIVLRVPNETDQEGYKQPPTSFLDGKWHVTHSSLPMWKTKRNVTITYKALAPSNSTLCSTLGTDRLDDLVEYQELGGGAVKNVKVHSITGVDKPIDEQRRDAWLWRGKGMLTLITSRWQVLGWGNEATATREEDDAGGNNQWVVTYFAKTLFTPAGLDFYSRSREGLGADTLQGIRAALAASGSEELRVLAGSVFEVTIDASR